MQVSVETGEGLERRLLVDLPADRVTAAVDKKLKEVARNVRLDGFRPGKVPLRVVKQRFGDSVRSEVYGDLIQATLYEAATQEKVIPVGEPKVELRDSDEDGGFSYTAIFDVMPEVKVADLAGQSLTRISAQVTDGDVDEMIEKLRKQRSTLSDVDRPAQDGDTVHIDFKGMMDGEAFEGGSAENVPLELGSGAMIEGFEAGLLGAAAGDERTLEVTFPDDYRATNLAGKAATFEVKVLKVSETRLPEIDDDFIRAFGIDDGGADALRADVRQNMEHELRHKLNSDTKNKVMDVLIEANPLDVPKAMVAQEAERMKQQAIHEMQERGQQASFDLPATVFEDQAKRRVHLGMLVAEIIKDQELKASEDQVRETIADFAGSYEHPEEVVDFYMNNKEQRASIENLVLENQVVDWVLSQVSVSDEPKGFSDVMGQ